MSRLTRLLRTYKVLPERNRGVPVIHLVPATTSLVDELLERVQDDVQLACPGTYYEESYRGVERNYWDCALGWISAMPKGIRVVDFGAAYCTLAVLSKRLLDAQVTCVDAVDVFCPRTLLDQEGIQHVKKHIEVDELADLGGFDLVIFTEVLEHLNFHPKHTLQKFRSVMNKGAMLILTTPDADQWGLTTKYYNSLDELPAPDRSKEWIDDHIWQYTDHELFALLAECGFKVEAFGISGQTARHMNVLCSVRP